MLSGFSGYENGPQKGEDTSSSVHIKSKNMPAYVIVEVDVKDLVRYEDYKKLTPGIVGSYGGKFIVRGGATETLEGEWNPGRVVVIEFPNVEQAKAFYTSPEYTAAKSIRLEASTGKIILVEGV